MRPLTLPLAFCACLAAGCGDPKGPGPGTAPDRAELVYEGRMAGIPEAFRIDTGGSGAPERILPAGTVAMDPTPSPDGLHLAFVVANDAEGTGDIFVVDRDGTGRRQLTTAPELDDSPAWSPDGSRIAFRSYRGGHDGEIWVMNADGTGAVNLTPTTGTAIIDNRRPSWSPDGRAIVFASTLGGEWGIWTMGADGGGKRQLTNTPALDAEPAWSPDGREIAFRRSDASGSDILVMPAVGGEPVRLALPGEQRLPAWSSDGRLIAFVGQPTVHDQPELYVMRADGREVRLVTVQPSWGGGLHPAWRHRD